MRADGSGSFKVVPASIAGWVDWSPDGTKLIYTNPLKSSDGTYHDDLYVVSVDPATGAVGTPALFAPGPSYDPNWSNDGTKVAFDRYPTSGGGSSSIIVRDVVTGAEYNFSALITTPNSWSWGPHWSPDGTMLAFEGDVRVMTTTKKGTTTIATPIEVFIANADGSGLFQVTPTSTESVSSRGRQTGRASLSSTSTAGFTQRCWAAACSLFFTPAANQTGIREWKPGHENEQFSAQTGGGTLAAAKPPTPLNGNHEKIAHETRLCGIDVLWVYGGLGAGTHHCGH